VSQVGAVHGRLRELHHQALRMPCSAQLTFRRVPAPHIEGGDLAYSIPQQPSQDTYFEKH
jgi:hypothetical protein